MTQLVHIEILEQGITELRMNDPHSRNGLTHSMMEQLIHGLSQASQDPQLRVLLLTGDENVFCSGATRELLEQLTERATSVSDWALSTAILEFPLPIIAVMKGHAIGGGLMLGLHCDITIASKTRRYGANFMNMGFTPGMGSTELLPMLVGYPLAAEILFSGRFYAGSALSSTGLFTRVEAANNIDAAALSLALSIADKPRYALESLKKTLVQPRLKHLKNATVIEDQMHDFCFRQPNFRTYLDEHYGDV